MMPWARNSPAQRSSIGMPTRTGPCPGKPVTDNPEDFKYLHAYSPYHRLRQGVCYPPTLVTTADHDDRVVPAHSFKFAAELQRDQACDNPVLIRIDVRSGHSAGKPTAKQIEQTTDELSFALAALGELSVR